MTNSDRIKYLDYVRTFLDKAEDAMDDRDEDAYQEAIDHADALLFVLMHEDLKDEE